MNNEPEPNCNVKRSLSSNKGFEHEMLGHAATEVSSTGSVRPVIAVILIPTSVWRVSHHDEYNHMNGEYNIILPPLGASYIINAPTRKLQVPISKSIADI